MAHTGAASCCGMRYASAVLLALALVQPWAPLRGLQRSLLPPSGWQWCRCLPRWWTEPCASTARQVLAVPQQLSCMLCSWTACQAAASCQRLQPRSWPLRAAAPR